MDYTNEMMFFLPLYIQNVNHRICSFVYQFSLSVLESALSNAVVPDICDLINENKTLEVFQ